MNLAPSALRQHDGGQRERKALPGVTGTMRKFKEVVRLADDLTILIPMEAVSVTFSIFLTIPVQIRM